MKCTKCGREFSGNEKFCDVCGEPLVSSEEQAQMPTPKQVQAQASEPGRTPQPVPSYVQPAALAAPKKEKKKTGLIIGIAVLAAVVLIGILVVFFAGKIGAGKSKPNEKGDPKTVEENKSEEKESGSEELEQTEESEEPSEAEEEPDIDVTSMVLQIEDKYEQIKSEMESGVCEVLEVETGVNAYFQSDTLCAIEVQKEADSSGYFKRYYYKEGQLIYARYEGADAQRFYFSGDQLIRWRTYPDASDSTKSTNYDMERTADYVNWEKLVKEAAVQYEAKCKTAKETRNSVPKIETTTVRTASASSYLTESQYNTVHLPERVLDGDLTTGWVEGAAGQGIGEFITITFDGVYRVSGLEMNAGYQKSDDLYQKNSRPKDIYISFSDGTGESHTLSDEKGVQKVQFSKEITTQSVTIRIDSVYPGTKYEDTVISELKLY